MKGKRGNRLFYMLIFDMLFIAALLFSLYSISEKSSARAVDMHDIDTKELGLLMDVLQAAPGTVEIGFSTQNEYVSKIEEDRVTIGKPLSVKELENNALTNDDYRWLSFGFGKSPSVTVQPDTSLASFFTLKKQSATITMSSEDDQITTSDCPQADTAKESPTFSLSGPLRSSQPDEYSRLILITDLTTAGLVERGVLESQTPDISIQIGFHDQEQFIIEYSPDNPEMEKLACLSKKFLTEATAQSITYRPSNSQHSEMTILLGTLDAFDRYRDQREDIASSITRAIAFYYGK